MTEATQELLLGALDTALAKHVAKLFGVLVASDPDEEALERFVTGLNRAVGAHERIAAMIGPDA